jgi:hypothetical protein
MKFFRIATAALLAASATVLAGCAAEPQGPQAAADARNPCIGVAPATGTIVRRSADCGGSNRNAATQEMIDEIRATQSIGRSPVKP